MVLKINHQDRQREVRMKRQNNLLSRCSCFIGKKCSLGEMVFILALAFFAYYGIKIIIELAMK